MYIGIFALSISFRSVYFCWNTIQGDLWFMDITAGHDFPVLFGQETSYKHASNFQRLWIYGLMELKIEV
jgi:hypothetical protein